MTNILIVDDEELARSMVRECLQAWPQATDIRECGDGFDALKAIQQQKPDLIFLDIQMPKINGFELLELLDEPPAVIFCTAYDEYALRAFEANAVDYLLKPFSQERFDKAFQKFLQSPEKITEHISQLKDSTGKSQTEGNRIVVKHHGNIRIIPAAEVLCVEAWDDYVKIHTAEHVFVKKQTLSWYEKSLPESQFLRVHRSFLVNMTQITAIEPGEGDNKEVRLKNGYHVPASRSGYQRLKEKLGI